MKTFTGPDAIKACLNYIKQVEDYVFEHKYKNPVKIIITPEQECELQKATTCYLCNGEFDEVTRKLGIIATLQEPIEVLPILYVI